MSNKQALFINRLVIAQTKIMGLVEEVAAGLNIDSEEGQERVADRFNTILYNLEEAYDTVIPEDEPEEEVEKTQTFEEFIEEFMEEFDYVGEAKEAARQILISAIDELKRKGGGYTLSGGLKNGIPTMFKLTVNRGTIRIELGDEGFVFEEVKEDDSFFGGSVEDDDYEEHEEGYEDEESYQHEDEEEEEDGRCNCPMCDGSWEAEEVEENVHEEVESILSYISSDIDELERVIGNYFGNTKLGASASELTEDDYALIRIYLIHVIEADRDEVNKLTDRGLLAAWNYHLYIKNNQ